MISLGARFKLPFRGPAALILGLAVFLPFRHGSSGTSGSSSAPSKQRAFTNFLTVHGPNDGEPLNQCADLRLVTDFQEVGMFLIFRDQSFLDFIRVEGTGIRVEGTGGLPVPGLLSSLSEAVYHLDTTRFPNGPLTLNIYLIPQIPDRVVAFTRWQRSVVNPVIRFAAPPQGSIAEVILEGRRGDEEFLLLAAEDEAALHEPPRGRAGTPNTHVVASGPLHPGQRSGASPSESPRAEIALDVDALFKIQKSNLKMVLWTGPRLGSWTRSKILDLKILIPPQKTPLPQNMPPPNPSAERPYLNGANH
ncbi:MAG: hypothetical protein HY717_19660 [Planctomycetes bacterium]|nr:hypothetical protein [Planctomycetota bacterium]